ncbi:MAG: M3 family metallopeptidase [Candidatus Hodarchaeales archaeon]|jgi:oligoendopeptidase F
MCEDILWDLTSLGYNDLNDPKIEKRKKEIRDKVRKLETRYKGKIHCNEFPIEDLLTVIQLSEEIETEIRILNDLGFLNFCTNLTDKEVLTSFNHLQAFDSKIRGQLAFVNIEIGKLLKSSGEKYLNTPDLTKYHAHLVRLKKKADHSLSEVEESLILEKDQFGVSAWRDLQSQIIGKKKFKLEIENEIETFSFGEFGIFRSHSDREVRKKSTEVVFNSIKQDADVLASCLRNVCADWVNISKRRSYKSPMGSSLLENDIDQNTFNVMREVINKNYDIIHTLIKIRAKALGIGRLYSYDLNAAFPGTDELTFTFEEARDFILDTLSEFDDDFGKIAKRVFDENRVDAFPRLGKRNGAFCADNYANKSSFILLNFNGGFLDVLTLAHELGHAIHASLMYQTQKYYNTLITDVLAESASEFCSLIVAEKMIEIVDDESSKRLLLFELISKMANLIFVILGRTYFEENVYQEIENGEFLDKHKFAELWNKTEKFVYGDSLVFTENDGYKIWTTAPQFYYPNFRYYNYPYSFAELFVLILYAKYKEEGKEFIPKFKNFLRAGSSKTPKEIVKEILGLEIENHSFWEHGIRELREMLKRLEKLF